MKLIIFAFLLLVTSQTLFADNTSRIELPIGSFGGRPTIDISLNNSEPFSVIIDTGLGGAELMLSSDKAKQLKLPETGVNEMNNLGGGQTLEITQHAAEQVMVGDATFNFNRISSHIMTMFTSPDAPEGVLSAWALSPGVITVDLMRQVISIDKEHELKDGSENTLELNTQDSLPSFKILINEQEYDAHIDTGSPIGLSLPLNLKSSFDYVEEPKVIGKARIPGHEIDIWEGRIAGSVELGSIVFENPVVKFLAPLRWVNIGAEIIKNHPVSIDMENGYIQFN
ncbi:hypothetical protein [Alteromonas facilis]|uniref:hypothetical protein n=1 Tax=Alteromonas facilis TaxID=2048004 RepID=UPI000C2908D0|nr:hypothetical protein [Alteromonas facilis]